MAESAEEWLRSRSSDLGKLMEQKRQKADAEREECVREMEAKLASNSKEVTALRYMKEDGVYGLQFLK